MKIHGKSQNFIYKSDIERKLGYAQPGVCWSNRVWSQVLILLPERLVAVLKDTEYRVKREAEKALRKLGKP